MKIYLIKDKEFDYGYLFVDNKYENCYIELIEGDIDYPVFFYEFVKKKKYMINTYWTKKWIEERVIPSSRHNINDILRDNGFKLYSEILLFLKVSGRSSMDDCYLKRIKYENLNEQIKNRLNKHITDFIYLKNKGLIIFFYDGKTKLINNINILNNKPFLSDFGEEIIYDTKNRFSYLELYENGNDIPFSYEDLKEYLSDNVYSSEDVTNEFGFSRQYLNQLKKNDDIEMFNEHYYLKNNIKEYKNKIK